MTGNDIAAVLTALGFLITSCASAASLIVSLGNRNRANRIETQQVRIAEDVQTIEKATNSMKDALVKATGDAARAEGTAVGLAQGRGEERPHQEDPIQKVEIVKIPPLPSV